MLVVVPPIDMRSHSTLRPDETKHWRVHVEGVQLAQSCRRGHSVLPVRGAQFVVDGFLVLPERAGDFNLGGIR